MCDCPCCLSRCSSTYDRPRWGLPGWCGCSCGNCIAAYASAAYSAGKDSLRGEMEERASALDEVERLTAALAERDLRIALAMNECAVSPLLPLVEIACILRALRGGETV